MPLASGFCIFHDEDYLQDKTNHDEHKRTVLNRLKRKVNHAISNNEPLFCIGFQLHDFSLSDLRSISNEFSKPVYFSRSHFFGKADFYKADFKGEVHFDGAKFQGEAYFFGANFQEETSFYGAKFEEEASFYEADFRKGADFDYSEFYGKTHFSGKFNEETKFNYLLFEGKEKVVFKSEDLSNVSFMNTDLTGVRFSDKARWGEKKIEYHKFWGGRKVKEDKFKIVDERRLEKKIKEKDGYTTNDFNLGSIKAVYRSLRENYEYRMRYDEAGQFFMREMELKRKYREVISNEVENSLEIKQNNWFRRNLLSLTGWYYHLSRYGESLWRPTLAGLIIVFLSTLFWLMQSNPTLESSLSTIECNPNIISDATRNGTSAFIGLCEHGSGNHTHWLKAAERSIADFIPLLPLGSNIKVGIIDYVIKIVGGAVTFGLIAIALRRRFERRYRH
jgi:uncharacterized protein YjbI with pentapeptide repeats